VDARLHLLQGKTKSVKPNELIAFLQEIYAERLAATDRLKAVAQHVTRYSANNAYQYAIGRSENHLQWLQAAVTEAGGSLPPEPIGPSVTIGRGREAWKALVAEDARAERVFVERWRPRVAAMTQARHRTMLELMLGEVAEHAQLLTDAAAGRDDVLGALHPGAGQRGATMGSRWVGD
jgi:hypothetical protein